MPPPFRSPASLLFNPVRRRMCRLVHSSSAVLRPESSSDTLEQAGPLACRLASRSVLRFRGPDAVKFLQGLLTNDVRSLAATPPAGENPTSPSQFPTPNVEWRAPSPIYAAMLTPQGRFLYDLFLYRPPLPEEKLDAAGTGPGKEGDSESAAQTLLADVDASVLDELVECFNKYRLRSKVEIENVSKELCCWQRFGGGLGKVGQDPEASSIGWGASADRTASSSAEGNNTGWQWYKDPRLDCLGFRGIFPSNTIPPLVESDKGVEEEHYLSWRLEKGVAEGSLEIPKGDAIPLEYNLVGLNAISFDKGCYVGQEFIARTHHRGVIRKRLLPLKFLDNSGEEVTEKVAPCSVVVDSSSGKKVGTVTTALGSRGMGVLRLEEVIGSSSLVIQDEQELKVNVVHPEWWPSEWTQELKTQSALG